MKLDYRMMSVREMNDVYPGFHIEDESIPVMLDPFGGFLESDKILQTHIHLAKVRVVSGTERNVIIVENER